METKTKQKNSVHTWGGNSTWSEILFLILNKLLLLLFHFKKIEKMRSVCDQGFDIENKIKKHIIDNHK